MKFLLNSIFFLLCITIFSCAEKELILPEILNTETELLQTRPSLRPDSVKVYPAFYNSVEVVYPLVQPERAVRSTISYYNNNNEKVIVEVFDFDKVVLIEGLEQKEYAFDIVYYTAEGKISNTVRRLVTPYLPVTDYIVNSCTIDGFLGNIYARWENITGKELEVEIKYEVNNEYKSIKKLTSSVLDSIIIEGLPNVAHDFVISVRDVNKNYSREKIIVASPGISSEDYTLESINVLGGFGRASVIWSNPSNEELELIFNTENGVFNKKSNVQNDTYLLANLKEGVNNIKVQVKNGKTGKITNEKLFVINVSKGVKETVSSNIILKSFGGNFAVLKLSNVTGVSTDIKVEYDKTNGQLFSQTYTVNGNINSTDLVFTEVKENAQIRVSITDDIGTISNNLISNVNTDVSNLVYLDRGNWAAYASSERDLAQSAIKVIDNQIGAGTAGWVNQWGSGLTDSLGKASTVFPHYLTLNMKSIQLVAGIEIVNHSNNVQNGPGEFILQYSLDGINFSNAQTFVRPTATSGGVTAANAKTIHNLEKPILAKYVRLYITKPDNSSTTTIRIAEIYVKGAVAL